MASARSNAGSFSDKMEGDTPAATVCALHPGPYGACEKCMDNLKMDVATLRDILNTYSVNEVRSDRELMIAQQKLSRYKREARKTRMELDDKLVQILSTVEDTQREVNARIDEITRKLADTKLCLAEKLGISAPWNMERSTSQQEEAAPTSRAARPPTGPQEGAASTSRAAGPPTGPRMCAHHEALGRNSSICSDEHCSMCGKLALPKRPHPEQGRPNRPAKKVDVEPQPPPVPPHSVSTQEGDELWTFGTQPDGGTEDGGDEDIIVESIVYCGKGHAPTK